jgi:hypothetical protein
MSAWKRIVIGVGLCSAALFLTMSSACWSGDIVYYPDHDAGDCDASDSGMDGGGGSSDGCH